MLLGDSAEVSWGWGCRNSMGPGIEVAGLLNGSRSSKRLRSRQKMGRCLGFDGGGARGIDCGDEQQTEKRDIALGLLRVDDVKRILEVVGSLYHRQGLDTTGCWNNLT